VLLGGGREAVALAILALACRMALCWCVERRFGTQANSYWLLPFRDVMSFAVYAVSFFGATVTWRGHRYRILSDGSLAQDRN
jgi:ceramide glucosyltransferase